MEGETPLALMKKAKYMLLEEKQETLWLQCSFILQQTVILKKREAIQLREEEVILTEETVILMKRNPHILIPAMAQKKTYLLLFTDSTWLFFCNAANYKRRNYLPTENSKWLQQ